MTLVGLRLALFSAAFFGIIGMHLPFWPVWLASVGMGPSEIGALLAAGIAMRMVGTLAAGHVADTSGERRRLMIVLIAAGAGVFALFATARSFAGLLAVSAAFWALWSGIGPLSENMTIHLATARGLDYGRIRLWGSLSFIATATAMGRLLAGGTPDLVFAGIVAAMGVTVIAGLWLPEHAAPRAAPGRLPLRRVLADRPFVLLLAATALIQGSHAVYYGFGTLHWQRAGHGEAVIGLLWAEGVLCEVLLFAFSGWVVRHTGPARLVVIGGLAAAVRWTAIGLGEALPMLILMQALHGLTFGATHLGTIHFIARRVAPELSATAQTANAAVVNGLGMALATLAAGRLYQDYSGLAFLAAAASGLVGGLLALPLVRRRAA